MSTTYEKAGKQILESAAAILCEFDTHQPLLDAHVKIDYLVARASLDEITGERVGLAMQSKGHRILGQARIMPLKQRAAGRGDAEICLDGDWWDEAGEDEQRGLLDHELHHLAVKHNKAGGIIYDDLQRPKLFIRIHDYEFGWFSIIARRHAASQERIQAKRMFDNAGQSYWPDLVAK